MELSDSTLRGASAFQLRHWFSGGRFTAARLLGVHLAAIAAENPILNAYVALDPAATRAAEASDLRRASGAALGRLDGMGVAIKDNLDVAGLATSAGLGSRSQRVAHEDASVVARLRAAGAVIIGKTALDEAALGTAGNSATLTRNPHNSAWIAGGSSAGSAAAVAAGLCAFAIGSDSLGSIRIPASHCGVFGLRPTHGQISTRGMLPAARRLDCVGILARSAADLANILRVLEAYDPRDARSRQRRVELAPPDWEPGHLRSGVLPDLAALGVSADVVALFNQALQKLHGALGECSPVTIPDYDATRMRRAALLLMESELALELEEDRRDAAHPLSPRLSGMLDYARGKSAPDYAAADRLLDSAVIKARKLFSNIDVLVLPTVPHAAYGIDEAERSNDADLTTFASVAGCPAVSLPMGMLADGRPVGLQLVGAPGSDLRLLELAEVCAATLDALPNYPVTR